MARGRLRVVLDTNVAISAILWQGTPSRLIAHAIEREIDLFASTVLLDELAEVLARRKLARAIGKPVRLRINFSGITDGSRAGCDPPR